MSTSTIYYQDDIYAPEFTPSSVDLPDEDIGGKDLEKYLNKKVWPAFMMERDRLERLERWGTGRQPEVRPLKRNTERAVLQRLARTPWIPLMISTFAQQMIVDGYRKEGETQNSKAWESWLRNKMTMQQLSINRATMMYGYSYVRVLKGTLDDNQATMAEIRGIDPSNCFALYRDSYADEYPSYVLERLNPRDFRWWLPNGDYYKVTFNRSKFELGSLESTEYGTPPFVRYVNQIDLKGRCWGDVEPVIDLAARIDKTAFDRLMVQHFNSFKVRWATGLEQADTPEGVEQDKIRLGNEDILIASDANARFGTLDETSMDGFIAAYKSDLEAFAAVMQLPPNLMGQVVNVAADALDGARRQTYQRLFEKQTVMGESHAQVMRLAALIEGRTDDAQDFLARISWQDVEVRSLAQFADAWGKIVSQLGVPKWAAWHKIPGVDQTEVETWKQHALDGDPFNTFLREVVGVTTTNVGVDTKTGKPKPPPAPPQPAGVGGPNNPSNQRPINNKTGVSRGSVS
ncbi:Phage portal protein, SPP1 Gp6 [Mycobacteroides abscessus subsp. massiliense]|nr:phage portal protein [Mycobacteroides abscessus]SKM17489.1 Phage portal protein, SPP1 Gp6 [Mycobacteroides abscessus subsp. massiliense]MDM2426937.1 phage portal protein [Mycobacteroides abscessus]MDM2431733.1 phage portal protein [Mycobacteroides abscessus]MDM2436654.1 phage portal protein [Mycobacteroides abscessus]